jgi:hypothetical protein
MNLYPVGTTLSVVLYHPAVNSGLTGSYVASVLSIVRAIFAGANPGREYLIRLAGAAQTNGRLRLCGDVPWVRRVQSRTGLPRGVGRFFGAVRYSIPLPVITCNVCVHMPSSSRYPSVYSEDATSQFRARLVAVREPELGTGEEEETSWRNR